MAAGAAREAEVKIINLIDDRAGQYVMIIRRGRVRRYRHVTPASLGRVRGLIRKQIKSTRG